MTKDKLTYIIKAIIKKNFELEVSVVKGTLSDYGLDSMQIVEIVLTLEGQFKIDISDDLVERWNNLTLKEIAVQILPLINEK